MGPRSRNITVALALAGFGLSASAAITNGSFEDPSIGAGAITTYANGSTAITGWTIVGTDVLLVDQDFLAPAMNLSASHLRQWLDLSGLNEGFGKGVETTFLGTVNGAYTVTFDVGRLLSRTPASVEVKIDGVSTIVTNSGAAGGDTMDWKPFSVSFISDGSTTLTFLGSAVNGGDGTLMGLDNVAVVPEPATYAMLLVGLAAVGFMAKRRRA